MAILKINVWWKIYITKIQIIQFCLDCSAFIASCIYAKMQRDAGSRCASWDPSVWYIPDVVAFSIILSYLLLFIQFYLTTYLSGKRAVSTKDGKKAEETKKAE